MSHVIHPEADIDIRNFSAGERQRIACARLILQNPDIVLLDEATSGLDTRVASCAEFMRCLLGAPCLSSRKFPFEKSTYYADEACLPHSYRLSTIRNMDKIFVFSKDDKVIAHGTHDELLAKNDYYQQAWRLHLGEELPDDLI